MKENRFLYAGSFDILTNGHTWLIEEASKLGDLYILVSNNPIKKYTHDLKTRQKIIRKWLRNNKIKANLISGENNFTAKIAEEYQINYLLRGLRDMTDFNEEQKIARMNKVINPNIQTLFLSPPQDLTDVSSSFIRGIIGLQNWVEIGKKYMPKESFEECMKKYLFDYYKDDFKQENILKKLLKNYEDRPYHGFYHLCEMISHMESLNWQNPNIKMAILFHDLIYETQSEKVETNEEASIKAFLEYEKTLSLDLDHDWICDFIKSTIKHEVVDTNHKEKTILNKRFLDLDLNILGSNPERFQEYDKSVREEYHWVPEEIYEKERKKILRKFLNEKQLYFTKEARDLWQKQAKENILNRLKL